MPHLPPGAVQKGLSSRWDKYLGMTAAMTQVPPRLRRLRKSLGFRFFSFGLWNKTPNHMEVIDFFPISGSLKTIYSNLNHLKKMVLC